MRKEGMRRIKKKQYDTERVCVCSNNNQYSSLFLPHPRYETLSKFHNFLRFGFLPEK